MAKRRMCYYVPHLPNGASVGADSSHFFPGIVFADEAGYYMTDWDWGTDREIAVQCVNELNEKLGVDQDEAALIVAQSMGMGLRRVVS